MRKFSVVIALMLLLMAFAVPFAQAQGTIVDVAASNDDFSILVQAVQAADPSIAEALSGPGPLTVFAPTNEAFRNLASFLDTDLESLLADQELLTQLLLYHVVAGEYFSPQVATLDDTLVPTLLPNTAVGITVNDDGSITLNSVADVVIADVDASNGVVHAIDQVIFPGVLRDRLMGLGSMMAEEEMTGDEEEMMGDDEEMMGETTHIRVAHFSADAPAVDVLVDGEVAISGLTFPEITDWIDLPAGSYEIAVTPAGDNETVVIGPVTLELGASAWSTVAAVGLLGDETLTATVVPEDYSELGEGEARVTVVHAIPDAPAVDVLAAGDVLLSGLAFPDSVEATVPAGDYDLAVVPSGETEPVVIDLSGTTLEAGGYYIVAAIGSLDAPDVALSVTFMDDMMMGEEEMTGDEEEPAEEEPVEEEAATENIAEVALGNPNFSTLVTVIQAADPAVIETLQGDDPLTVFAPTNAAFDALFATLGFSAEEVIELGGAELLTPVLLYHVVEGAVPAADVSELDGQTVPTLLGEEILITIDGDNVILNDSVNVIIPDVMASNGVVHVVDQVLLPQVTIDTLAALGIELGG